MKKNTIFTFKKLKDGAKFKLSKRASGAVYELVSKKKGIATYSSVASKRSFTEKDLSKQVYPV